MTTPRIPRREMLLRTGAGMGWLGLAALLGDAEQLRASEAVLEQAE